MVGRSAKRRLGACDTYYFYGIAFSYATASVGTKQQTRKLSYRISWKTCYVASPRGEPFEVYNWTPSQNAVSYPREAPALNRQNALQINRRPVQRTCSRNAPVCRTSLNAKDFAGISYQNWLCSWSLQNVSLSLRIFRRPWNFLNSYEIVHYWTSDYIERSTVKIKQCTWIE